MICHPILYIVFRVVTLAMPDEIACLGHQVHHSEQDNWHTMAFWYQEREKTLFGLKSGFMPSWTLRGISVNN